MNRLFISAMALVALTLAACKEDPAKCESVSGATFSSSAGEVTTILETKCGTPGCHVYAGGGSVEWIYYNNYDSLADHFSHFYEEVIENGTMPPDTSTALTQEERDIIECWKEAGFPE